MRDLTPTPPGGGPPRSAASLEPRWLWALFAVIALAIPALGLLLEHTR